MPKGIRKACANCIKARLACDEGRPCQRCVVHQCDCVAVARKPRVKKQKIDLEPPAIDTKPSHIPTIDSSVEVVASNWGQNEFVQGAFNFQLDKSSPEEIPFDLNAALLSPSLNSSKLSPAIDSPPLMMASPPTISTPSPPQPQSPSSAWVQRQLQAALMQQYTSQASTLRMQSVHQQPIQQPMQQTVQSIQPAQLQPQMPQTIQVPQQQISQPVLQQQQALLQHLQRQNQLLKGQYDNAQMLSLLLEEKPTTLLNDWQETPLSNYIDGQQVFNMNYASSLNPAPFKKTITHTQMNLPQAKNSTPLFPAPIAVFDKQKFQLLDANEAMANFVGHTTVASLSTEVVTMDDLVDPEAAHIAKNAYTNFIANPSPCFRICEIRTRTGQPKTVEFHVDLTEQLLILTIKSVLDTCAGLHQVVHETPLIKKGITQQCNCKACEFLSPID